LCSTTLHPSHAPFTRISFITYITDNMEHSRIEKTGRLTATACAQPEHPSHASPSSLVHVKNENTRQHNRLEREFADCKLQLLLVLNQGTLHTHLLRYLRMFKMRTQDSITGLRESLQLLLVPNQGTLHAHLLHHLFCSCPTIEHIHKAAQQASESAMQGQRACS
jgi:hypothetical protein